MKAKLVLSLLVLGLTATSFGIVVGDFEGSTDTWYVSGWNPGDAIAVDTIGATTGTGSIKITHVKGGWDSTMERPDNLGTPVQAALASVGTVTVDVTAFGSDFPAGWAQIGLLVNATGLWNTYDWHNIALDGTTNTLTFQLPADAMAAIGAITSSTTNPYVNFGFVSNTGSNTADPITGEWINPTMAVYYMDNIQVVPEPATMLMLGLGGVLSLIRKR